VEKISDNRDEERMRYMVRRPEAYKKMQENDRKIQRTD
jgi:hypothetical protein